MIHKVTGDYLVNYLSKTPLPVRKNQNVSSILLTKVEKQLSALDTIAELQIK